MERRVTPLGIYSKPLTSRSCANIFSQSMQRVTFWETSYITNRLSSRRPCFKNFVRSMMSVHMSCSSMWEKQFSYPPAAPIRYVPCLWNSAYVIYSFPGFKPGRLHQSRMRLCEPGIYSHMSAACRAVPAATDGSSMASRRPTSGVVAVLHMALLRSSHTVRRRYNRLLSKLTMHPGRSARAVLRKPPRLLAPFPNVLKPSRMR